MRLPCTAVEFTTSGDPADPRQIAAAVTSIGAVTDVLLVSHGWNNDMPRAQRLIDELSDNVDTSLSGRFAGRSLAVVGLLWPSKQWGSDEDDTAGGGLSAVDSTAELKGAIRAAVEDPAAAEALLKLADSLNESESAQAEFLSVLRGQLPLPEAVADDDAAPVTLRAGDTGAVFGAAGDAVVEAAVRPVTVPDNAGPPSASPFDTLPDPLAGAGSGSTGLLDLIKKPVRAATELLNVTTFYRMKERSGAVGSRGVVRLLEAIDAAPHDVRVHLAGHSFGARVVAMAAATTTTPIASVSLLQGAFSHRGLAVGGGFHRLMSGPQLRGPVIVTHTHNDRAVRLAYAVASRLAKQSSSGMGDAGDPYGGLGANGAVGTAEAVAGTLGDRNASYLFAARKVHNLKADKFVANHSDVTNPAVANAVATAVAG
ncbi:hypothetical protein [Paractinoplanes maris]|uniref:hypothetical protein n=1 Tax=Paractinoplanes maris TaxID=1734446 RepID=UPI002021E930|nr:hypothetical protein [Actinoplanes maris]